MSRDAEKLGSTGIFGGCTEGGVPLAAFFDDIGGAGVRFDVVDNGWSLKKTTDRGEGGVGEFEARHSSFAHEGAHEGGFFTAFVGAGTKVEVEVEIESGALDVFAEKSARVGFINGLAEGAAGVNEFSADIDVADFGLRCKCGDGHPFDENKRGCFHDLLVFERARFAFVGVAEDVVGLGLFFGDAVPLDPGGESGSAASAQAGGFDFIDDGLAFHSEGFFEPLVSAFGLVAFEGFEFGVVGVFE